MLLCGFCIFHSSCDYAAGRQYFNRGAGAHLISTPDNLLSLCVANHGISSVQNSLGTCTFKNRNAVGKFLAQIL